MPKVYQKALENMKNAGTIDNKGKVDHTSAVHGLTQVELALHGGTHGGVIMSTNPADVNQLFTAFMNRFDPTTTTNWNWLGSVSYLDTRAAGLLDGDFDGGECKIIASALMFLVHFPRPLGLGLSGAEIVMHKPPNGFFAYHDKSGVFGLPPDVAHPHCDLATRNHMQSLCFWTNHKVMKYGAKYYDPSYGNTYDVLSDMEAFRVTGVKKAGASAVLVKNRAPTTAMGWWDAGLTMYMVEVFTPQFMGYKGPYRDVG
jgi:hypothetical protein